MEQDLPVRKRLRLAGIDYSRAGAYFVTICAKEHRCLFGWIENGQVVERLWRQIPEHYPEVELDAFVVMPNHVHGILIYAERDGHARPVPTVIGSFKSAVSRRLGRNLWQRGFWDRVIRNDAELNLIRHYIDDNPLRPSARLDMLVYR